MERYFEHAEVPHLLEVCKYLYQRNMLAATDGNVSYRLSSDKIVITPTQRSKYDLKSAELALVGLNGEVLAGNPSSELPLHLEIYRLNPDAKAVVHAHPPYTIAWTIAKPEMDEFPIDAMSELILGLGKVPIAPYARPGTVEMAAELGEYARKHRVVVMSRHGAVSWGETISEAHHGMERLEHAAQILVTAQQLGGISKLPEAEVKHLQSVRVLFNNRSL